MEGSRRPVFVVVGGGIAGVSCAETLVAYNPGAKVIIVSASPLIKAVRNVHDLTQTLVLFDVVETSIADYTNSNPCVTVLHCSVKKLDTASKTITTSNGDVINYTKVCICTGARSNVIFPENKNVIGIRDTGTAVEFDAKLKNAEQIVVVGNGGIAIELVFQVQHCNVVWVVKDKAIGQVFFDPGAAQFFLPLLTKEQNPGDSGESEMRRMTYKLDKAKDNLQADSEALAGGALGPDWHTTLNLKGLQEKKNISLQYQCEVESLVTGKDTDKKSDGSAWPVFAKLSNGKTVGCDFVVSATGVVPNVGILHDTGCTVLDDGGVEIDLNMKVVGLNDVYAAGDVCSASRWPRSDHWHQMRLWTQARQMGMFAAQCMVAHHNDEAAGIKAQDVIQDICFDLFTHATNFFGKRVILLGRYNAQDIDNSSGLEFLVRTTPGEEYIKVVMLNGRMQGAVLIGETDLEETFENLILNGLDLSMLGEDLLDPDVDITDYFD